MADETQQQKPDPQRVNSLQDFVLKVLVGLCTFCIVGLFVTVTSLKEEVAILKDHEKTVMGLKDALIDAQRSEANKNNLELIDIKIKMSSMDQKLNDIIKYKDDNLIEQDKQKK